MITHKMVRLLCVLITLAIVMLVLVEAGKTKPRGKPTGSSRKVVKTPPQKPAGAVHQSNYKNKPQSKAAPESAKGRASSMPVQKPTT
jgi:hypothetical protein